VTSTSWWFYAHTTSTSTVDDWEWTDGTYAAKDDTYIMTTSVESDSKLDDGTTDDDAEPASEPRPVLEAGQHHRALAGIGAGGRGPAKCGPQIRQDDYG
jgi:hypothetical protein